MECRDGKGGTKPTVSVGVCAYNEERNIRRSLESITSQALQGFELAEVIVVSSGSTDGTDEAVRTFGANNRLVRLIPQPLREGKNSAVNLFMSWARGDILVLVNADNVLVEGALQNLLVKFNDPQVGIAGGHPVPVNPKDTVTGFAVHMLWGMHHRVSLHYPKIGELIAFRNIHVQLPTDLQSDEDIIRMEVEKRGYRSVYAPEAIVRNKGPATVRDFIKQRTRVNIGEGYMKRKFSYDIPTQDPRLLFSSFLDFIRDSRSSPFLMGAAMLMEAYCRAYARLYVALDKGDKMVWSPVDSTKNLST
ncbi:MAG: glycosyltransferase [Methanomassiliicoccus sp.]|nr:glycosyltransferase [Methanomassiliicoccus sp.]